MYLYGNSEEGDLLVRTGPNGELPENVRLLGSYKETQEENISVAGENFRTFFGYGYKTISQEEVEKRRNEFADGSLTTLDLKQKCISSLDGIDYFKKLKVLKLPNNSINDISPLAALDDLEALDLSGNCIVDVSPLSGLKKLKVLNLAGNFIEDVSSLASLTGLQELYLYNNKIKDLSVLNKKLDVKILDCANNPGYGLP